MTHLWSAKSNSLYYLLYLSFLKKYFIYFSRETVSEGGAKGEGNRGSHVGSADKLTAASLMWGLNELTIREIMTRAKVGCSTDGATQVLHLPYLS